MDPSIWFTCDDGYLPTKLRLKKHGRHIFECGTSSRIILVSYLMSTFNGGWCGDFLIWCFKSRIRLQLHSRPLSQPSWIVYCIQYFDMMRPGYACKKIVKWKHIFIMKRKSFLVYRQFTYSLVGGMDWVI